MFDRKHAARMADGLAVALAASLPWSTSATSILAALLLLALIPQSIFHRCAACCSGPSVGSPVLLVALAAIGMLWADVPWAQRLQAFPHF